MQTTVTNQLSGQCLFQKLLSGLFCFILISVCVCQIVRAQSEEEMRILSLFYEEKDLVVQTATRHPKHISQVAENMSVITAKEIEAMNAHTVAEVLNRVPGLFVDLTTHDFCSLSMIGIQGSDRRHVLVLIDGFAWNPMSSGAVTNPIPVGIIERIEIIKGPASSAWGSSLGGVVNIITKSGPETQGSSGSVRASYGKSKSQDHRADIQGRTGSVGYYLFADHKTSDGLLPSRSFDNTSVYSKLDFSISEHAQAGMSAGYSAPDNGIGDFPNYDITTSLDTRTCFATAFLNTALTQNLDMNLSFHTLKVDWTDTTLTLGQGVYGDAPGERFTEVVYDDQYTGLEGKFVWKGDTHTIVLGADWEHLSMDKTIYSGTFYQELGTPPIIHTSPGIDRWAIYANDTFNLGKWSFTPGIRYDHNEISGSFVSPSLGITYHLGETSIFRASAARGFATPHIEALSGGGRWLDPNPSLDPEEVRSYQVGMESGAAKYVWIKASYFRHDMKNFLYRDGRGGQPENAIYKNDMEEVQRQGVEIELETMPVHNVSLSGGFSYVDINPPNDDGAEKQYTYNLRVQYDDKDSFKAQFFGHYVWWHHDAGYRAKYDDFLWDMNLSKIVYAKEELAAEVFFTVHNMFNASQYSVGDLKNPGRWAEGGIRFKF